MCKNYFRFVTQTTSSKDAQMRNHAAGVREYSRKDWGERSVVEKGIQNSKRFKRSSDKMSLRDKVIII